ncbi:hypothetical protein HG471_002465 [Candidatus Saccharibacteria bacterium]|nr:hypothetical protein [Candidatus Saccharibacteria bacterium]
MIDTQAIKVSIVWIGPVATIVFFRLHQKNIWEEICDDWHSNLILAQTFLARNSNYA